MQSERRYSGVECRAVGRTLSGPVIRYGEISPSHKERFLPDSLDISPGATYQLDYRHDFYRPLTWTGAGLFIENTAQALNIRAEIPETPLGNLALREVANGRLSGFSLEFEAKSDDRSSGIRVVESADLKGIGLVGSPSYPGSRVELRAKSGRTMRSEIPIDTALACDCAAGTCDTVIFSKESVQEMYESAKSVIAVRENYSAGALGSIQRGTVRLLPPTAAGMTFEIDMPDSDAGRAVIAAHEDAGVIVRPFVDADSVAEPDGDNNLIYRSAKLRALIVSVSDRRDGWPDPELIATPEIEQREQIIHIPGRPRWR